jgi:mannose-6-phosphate isomerase-like protein (cupin superfamily)
VRDRRPALVAARDASWRSIAPGFERLRELIGSGLPFHVAADRQQDARPDGAQRLDALDRGATVFLPQAHQVLPRVARLMVALRATLLGPFRDEASYLFLVDGRGREGMGLHHDGDVDAFWLQLEGRRTVTLGPPVRRGTPEELGIAPTRGRGWRTHALAPGSLLYVPPRTPHRVVCHERSLALTLTWTPPRRRARTGDARARAMVEWDVAAGRAEPWPPDRDGDRLWTQVPAAAGPVDRARRRFTLWTADGRAHLPVGARAVAAALAAMPSLRARATDPASVAPLIALGILAEDDLPRLVIPDDPSTLDGWEFL